MCEWGTSTCVRVKIQADLSRTGRARWKAALIDSCIAPLVDALQKGGIDMRASCCGHGKALGRIDLQDGRTLWITTGRKEIMSMNENELWAEYGKAHVTRGGHSLAVHYKSEWASTEIYLAVPPGYSRLPIGKEVPVMLVVQSLVELPRTTE